MDRYVRLDRDAEVPAVAVVTLDRPAAANAIDLAQAQQLLDITLEVADDSSVRAVLLRGEGRFFCGGGDVRSFAERPHLARHLRSITVPLHAAVSALRRMDAPVVAAVNGPAAGAGFALACGADLVVAARSATFVLAYADIGLTLDAGASWFLPRLVGARRAAVLALTGRRLSADEAESWGIVSHVVPDDDLHSEALALARQLATGPTVAFGLAKRLLLSSFDRSLEAQLDEEARALSASAATDDATEGIRAFVDRRPPKFGGG
jgi:2-(1,2-epoxy-1,2-dihydrophenyl)acetyl-CoA isomerase